MRGKVLAPLSQMDSGQHHFLVSVCEETIELQADVILREASAFAAEVGDNTIGTKRVAAVLDLEEGTGPA